LPAELPLACLPQAGTVTLRPTPDHVHATFRLATVADLGAAVTRCRRLLDLDADPGSYLAVLASDPALAPLTKTLPGLRLPGTVDSAETALRTVLGPHAQTLVAALADPLPTGSTPRHRRGYHGAPGDPRRVRVPLRPQGRQHPAGVDHAAAATSHGSRCAPTLGYPLTPSGRAGGPLAPNGGVELSG
jgi:hypothetical protein